MMKYLQKLGKSLMLPVACLPVCGILMGIGYALCPSTDVYKRQVNITPDQKYLCAVDLGVDQVKIYKFNDETGKITLVDMLRCE